MCPQVPLRAVPAWDRPALLASPRLLWAACPPPHSPAASLAACVGRRPPAPALGRPFPLGLRVSWAPPRPQAVPLPRPGIPSSARGRPVTPKCNLLGVRGRWGACFMNGSIGSLPAGYPAGEGGCYPRPSWLLVLSPAPSWQDSGAGSGLAWETPDTGSLQECCVA